MRGRGRCAWGPRALRATPGLGRAQRRPPPGRAGALGEELDGGTRVMESGSAEREIGGTVLVARK